MNNYSEEVWDDYQVIKSNKSTQQDVSREYDRGSTNNDEIEVPNSIRRINSVENTKASINYMVDQKESGNSNINN